MKSQNKIPQKMINDAKKLYVKYGGREIARIESEMHAQGWPAFRRRVLYNTSTTLGWPERFGWPKLLTAAQLAALGRRNRGRHNFERWLAQTFPEWTWNWKYQRHIYERLADVTSGKCKRLMIFMPPRHGKSEMITIRYAAWRLLDDPKLNLILGSYNQKLANKFSRKIKRIVTGDRLQVTSKADADPLPVTHHLSPAQRLNTNSEWETAGGGVVRSVGVGAGIAGFGGGLIIIDDPVKNRAEAESETYRDRVDEWFRDDIYTRLEPNAAIILIQTRWHEDDLAGRLIREQDNGGEKWEVISLPALAEEDRETRSEGDEEEVGEKGRQGDKELQSLTAGSPQLPVSVSPVSVSPVSLSPVSMSPVSPSPRDPLGRRPGTALCPERFDEAALAKIRTKLGSYSFSALYQQSPAPADGGRFKRSWFKNIVDRAPDGMKWKRGWDLAVSIKTSADYTASFRCAKDAYGNLYIADGIRKRIEYPDQRRLIISHMQHEQNTEHGIEAALHGRALIQDLRRDWQLGRFAFRQIPVRGDKLTRALSWLNLAEEGKVILVRGPWIDDFIDEITRFPTGKHDDQLDAVSLAVQMLSTVDNKLYTF